ncbi:glucose-6-phosphate isomerase [Aliikangiella sp. IMCC44653]
MSTQIDRSEEWKTLSNTSDKLSATSLSLLLNDKERVDALTFSFDQLIVDFSKQKVTQTVLAQLLSLANQSELKLKIKKMLSGETVNVSENKPALHSALRLPANNSLYLHDKDISIDVQSALLSMEHLIQKITSSNWMGVTDKPMTDVVNIGVGGSDIGVLLGCSALDEFSEESHLNFHFVSAMDGSHLEKLFKRLNPETTLFVVVSKSFTTADTLANAESARSWLRSSHACEKEIMQKHFIGISASATRMSNWGIVASNQLPVWDWVGGRFSIWSCAGFVLALKIGMRRFREMLNGAHAMDNHFASAPLESNLPVLLGLISIWNVNFQQINTHAVLPYDARLRFLPTFLSQLEMESNGKQFDQSGESINFLTSPILMGQVGSNAQHTFYQLLHQGKVKLSSDFIIPIKRLSTRAHVSSAQKELLDKQHLLTLANCLAQSGALAMGNTSRPEQSSMLNNAQYKTCYGGHPSTTILLRELTPYSLGQLIALYEHKVFAMASVWDINPFDQWGVELGKSMSNDLFSAMKSNEDLENFDLSTQKIIKLLRENR